MYYYIRILRSQLSLREQGLGLRCLTEEWTNVRQIAKSFELIDGMPALIPRFLVDTFEALLEPD